MPKTSPCAHAKQAHLQAQLRNLTATKLETAKRSSQHSGGAIRPYSNRVHPTLRRPRLADVGLGGTPFNWNFLRLPSGQSIHFLEDFRAVFLAWARPRLPLPSLPFPLQAAMPDGLSRQSAGPQEPFPVPQLSSRQEPRRIAPVLKGGSNIDWGVGRSRLIGLPRKLFACGEESCSAFRWPIGHLRARLLSTVDSLPGSSRGWPSNALAGGLEQNNSCRDADIQRRDFSRRGDAHQEIAFLLD